jgi:branched-subunit amino acid transport protein AzlD
MRLAVMRPKLQPGSRPRHFLRKEVAAMSDHRIAIAVILAMGLATFATRIVPVLLFGRGSKVPDYVMYLGKVVPYTAMGLLIVYCLKDVQIMAAPHALPEIVAMAVVVLSYLWKRNSILSVVIGTVLYMLMVQNM